MQKHFPSSTVYLSIIFNQVYTLLIRRRPLRTQNYENCFCICLKFWMHDLKPPITLWHLAVLQNCGLRRMAQRIVRKRVSKRLRQVVSDMSAPLQLQNRLLEPLSSLIWGQFFSLDYGKSIGRSISLWYLIINYRLGMPFLKII